MLTTLIVASPFIALGLYILWAWKKESDVAAEARAWPRASGTILEARIAGMAPAQYDPSITLSFAFTVAGIAYTGRRLGFFDLEQRMNGDEMAAVVARYSQGSQVQVCYRPSDPAYAVLEPDNALGAARVRNMGTMFLAIGLLILLVGAAMAA